ncbi:GDYXXLXY domain-containing protein [Heliophilum fasciatum]|uniref:Putative membrane-anchored protein n=1 Tax=Heliophilum fasciatum TaxID=35700 RepID=A0A4R2RXE7_9FIRM|nr:GDYXXLXY domain-containing protein [Heliophilum fasciatum]MCW2277847.1 putative membrane-anchored protein [Heliophilum fasciatum]TCP64661.1 putative membrane-anchored protein [Heliophilum fasciatum]
MKRRYWALLLGFQVLVLLALAGSHYWIIDQGTTIRLQTLPIDPRNLFMGDYVALGYPFSEVDLQEMPNDLITEEASEDEAEALSGTSVYALLTPQNGLHQAIGIYRNPPALADDQVLLRGKIVYAFRRPPGPPENPETWAFEKKPEADVPLHRFIRVNYGLESFYVPEGTGGEYEERIRQTGNVIAEAKVWKGRAVLTDLVP